MVKTITKRKVDSMLKQYAEEPVVPPEPRKSHIALYTLLVSCAIFLCMVYLNAQMNARIDKLEMEMQQTQTPFCYGFNPEGIKGFAVDERKVNTPCAGFNVTQ